MSDHDMWRGVGRVRDLGPGDEMSPAELELYDEPTVGDMTVGDLGELIRTRYTELGYRVRIDMTRAGWHACAIGVDGEILHAHSGSTLGHALEALLGGDE